MQEPKVEEAIARQDKAEAFLVAQKEEEAKQLKVASKIINDAESSAENVLATASKRADVAKANGSKKSAEALKAAEAKANAIRAEAKDFQQKLDQALKQ